MNELVQLKYIDEIPFPYRKVFSEFVCFNSVQSKVLADILYTDDPVVLSAPTGSGKTVVFELGIVKLLMEYGSDNLQDFKIVYISPIKSLCQERLVDWNRKFSQFGINCICVTGDSDNIDYHQLTNHNLIISTPEKWDSLTRKWRDNETLVRVVKLFMIDEVHLLNEDDRGSTLEVIVSRMKTVQNAIPRSEIGDCQIRFMAVSATIGNVEDIAAWLNCRKFFQFSEETRPVQLKKMVLGYNNQNSSAPFKFDLSLNYRLQGLIIQHSEGQPTLIFCSTRKSVEMTAKHLFQTLKIQISPLQSQNLSMACNSIPDVKIKETIKYGIGIHHAGMSMETRHAIENVFRDGYLPILVATSTLAMGVNLPAHLVIIKSTKYYNNGSYQDYTATAIHQMIGRAGRPQFDVSATALILTTNDDKKKIEKLLSSNEPVESNLHKHLTEHLNAEVVLGTITGLDVAMEWLASTFLYIRARKNPRHYGLPQACRQDQLDKKLLEMFQIDLNKLMRVGMITMDEQINVSPTLTGRLMARYYVDFETMKMFTQITGTEVFIQILALISKCQEFSELRLRVNDKKTLNLLNRNSKKPTIRFPLNGKIKTWDMKVNCIIQAVLGNLEITDPSIQTEAYMILRNGQRIIKCLIDYLSMKKENCYTALLNSIILSKCLQAKLWDNSPFVSKQLNNIGSILATQLANAGKNTFEKILESNPREIELIIKRKPPFGNYLLDEVRYLPRYSMKLEKCLEGLKLNISLQNVEELRKKCTLNQSSIMYLIVGNSFNEILIYERYKISYLIENPEMSTYINVKLLNNVEFVEAHLISDVWVGIDRSCEVLLENENKYNEPSGCSSRIVETSHNAKQSSYIQTFLDIYMKIKKPEKHKKVEKKPNAHSNQIDNSKQTKNKQKRDNKKNAENSENKIKALYDHLINNKVDDRNKESIIQNNEELSLPKNLSDSELVDILEDHKIITAYKNLETTNLNEENDANEPDDADLNTQFSDDLFDALDDHKIITAFPDELLSIQNAEHNFEEIVYSNNDVQEYEEIVDSNNGVQEYEDAILFSPARQVDKEQNNYQKIDKEGENEENNVKDSLETDILRKELGNTHNLPSSILFSEMEADTNNANAEAQNTELIEVSNESDIQNITEKMKEKLDTLTKTDRTLFLISQKYLTDIDNEDTPVNKPSTKGSMNSVPLRNILNFKGKKKRKTDDLHPEEIEDQIHKEERQKEIVSNKFKKPQKKRLQNNLNDIFSNSTRPGPSYQVTEILETESRPKTSDHYLENQKSIKWRSPLILSPRMKFSPKVNYKNMFGESTEIETETEIFNDSYETALSSGSSKNVSMKIPKTPRRSKTDRTNFKSFTSTQATSFPLSDRDYKNSPHTPKYTKFDSIEKFSDICSTQLLDDLQIKDATFNSKKLTQSISTNAGEYYSQLAPRNITPKTIKKECKKDFNASQFYIENKENSEDMEEEPIPQKKSRVNLNSSRIMYEPSERDSEYSSPETTMSYNKSQTYDHPSNEIRTRSEEYIDAKVRENYPVYPDFEVPTYSRYFATPPIEYDSRIGSSPSLRSVVGSVPKASMHYSSYVDPAQFGYHPTYGQYMRPCCEYPTNVRRNLPPGYVEYDVRPSVGYNMTQHVANVETNYQTELSEPMTLRQRSIPEGEFIEPRQVIPQSTPVTSTSHVYADPVRQDLNSSFVIRNPSYSSNYQAQNFVCPVSYRPSSLSNVGYYSRGHPHPYEYVAENPSFPTVDKEYVMNKYWGSLNSQQH